MRYLLFAALLLPVGALVSAADTKPRSAFDKPALETYLRHYMLIDPRVAVKIDDPRPSPVNGLKKVDVHMSMQGRTQDEVVYISDNGQDILVGKLLDFNASPFQTELSNIKTDLSPSFGTAGAPAVLVMYADFQCPACKEEAKTLRQNLLQKYPTQVRVYFKDFPLEQIHPWARAAAVTGRCIYRQSPQTFWTYYDWIYDHQTEITAENLKDKVAEFSKTAGVDTVQMGRCTESASAQSEIDRELAEGRSLNIDQTPTLFLNGRRLPGSIPWQNLQVIIDEELGYQKTAQDAGEKCCEVKVPTLLNK